MPAATSAPGAAAFTPSSVTAAVCELSTVPSAVRLTSKLSDGQPAQGDAAAAVVRAALVAGDAVALRRGGGNPGRGERAAVIDARHVAVLLPGHDRDAHEQAVLDQRHIGHAPQVHEAARAVAAGHRTGVAAGRLLGIQLDRAAFGVHARQRALRAAQDFDAIEVHQGEIGAGQIRVVHIVDVETDAG